MKDVRLVIFVLLNMFFLIKDVRLVISVLMKICIPDERCSPVDICNSEDMYS